MSKVKLKFDNYIKYFNKKTFLVFFLDAAVISLSFLLAVLIKGDLKVTYDIFVRYIAEIPIVIFIYLLVFELFNMNRSIWKFAGLEEVIKAVAANAVAIFTSYIMIQFVFEKHLNSSFYIIAFFVITFSTLLSRTFFSVIMTTKTIFKYNAHQKKALIVGAGQAGVMVYNELEVNPKFESHIVGFIDDDVDKIGKYIHGVRIIGDTSEIESKIKELEIDVVYVAIPQAGKEKTKELLNQIEKTGAKIKLMPPFYEMLQESFDGNIKLRDINIEDLLGREPIVLEEDGIREYIDSKTILVTGGGGSIGSELCRQLRHYNPKKIVIVDIYENNAYDLQMEFERLYRDDSIEHKPEINVLIASVRDEKRLDELFKEYKPDVVFHAAAHKHVPLMEFSPKEAIKNNVLGTYNVAKMADKYLVKKFVFISTDKAVNPTNVMGATKRFAEKIIMELNENSKTDYAAVRFGNVLGSNGSVIPLFKKQIEDGGPVTVTHKEIIRYFMTIPEACQLVIQAGAYAKGGELFVLDMGDQVKILDLAEKLIRLSGLDPYIDIDIKFTGLRPGEKMYEELLVDYDKTIKTQNDKIYVEPVCTNGVQHVIEKLAMVDSALDKSNNEQAIKLLKEYVSTFKSNGEC